MLMCRKYAHSFAQMLNVNEFIGWFNCLKLKIEKIDGNAGFGHVCLMTMVIMITMVTTTVGSLVNVLVLRWEIVGRWFDRHGWEQTHCVTYLSLRTPPSNATQGYIQFTVEHFVQALRCAFAGCFCVFSWAPNTWWEQFFTSAIRPHGGVLGGWRGVEARRQGLLLNGGMVHQILGCPAYSWSATG